VRGRTNDLPIIYVVPQQQHMYPMAQRGLLAMGCIDHPASLCSHIANKYTRVTDRSPLDTLAMMHNTMACRYRYSTCLRDILPDGNGLCGFEILSSSTPMICGSHRISVFVSQRDLTSLVFDLAKSCQATQTRHQSLLNTCINCKEMEFYP
jgi:hypothetical protein